MSNKITVKTGVSAPTNGALAIGEFGFDTVASKLYVGTGPTAPIETHTGAAGPTTVHYGTAAYTQYNATTKSLDFIFA